VAGHCGETGAVTSLINGAGKTRHIMQLTAERQRQTRADEQMLLYRRLPVREAGDVTFDKHKV
jgi:hypothetical protein